MDLVLSSSFFRTAVAARDHQYRWLRSLNSIVSRGRGPSFEDYLDQLEGGNLNVCLSAAGTSSKILSFSGSLAICFEYVLAPEHDDLPCFSVHHSRS